MSNDQQSHRPTPEDQFAKLLGLLERLDEGHLQYVLQHTRSDSLMVDVQMPGERWEIEFMLDGSLEIERYRSTGDIDTDPALLDELFRAAE